MNEGMIDLMLKVNRWKVVLTSVYFPHTGYADQHIEKMYTCIETYTNCSKNTIIARDLTDELGHGIGAERLSVGQYTLNESKKCGDLSVHWLIIERYVEFQKKKKDSPKMHATSTEPIGAKTNRDPKEAPHVSASEVAAAHEEEEAATEKIARSSHITNEKRKRRN